MRKELLVFVDTGEQGEEISVVAVSNNRNLVLFGTPVGKFTVSREQLKAALKAIEDFDGINNTNVQPTLASVLDFETVEYGDE